VPAAGILQALLLQAAEERMQRLMPRLHAKLSKLKGDMELARARCQASSGALLGQTRSNAARAWCLHCMLD
jgi:hypothetical protein